MRINWLFFFSSCTGLAIASLTTFCDNQIISTAQPLQQPKAYQDALIDAADPRPDEILSSLTVINLSNQKIKWEGQANNRRVLVVTFTNENVYQPGIISPKSDGIWVTIVPELYNFCKQYKEAGIDRVNLNERLVQLLGLPPKPQYTHIAEIAVAPQYLRRTTLDPDISNYASQTFSIPISSTVKVPSNVDPVYKAWFIKQVSNEINKKYPWTRLGYTYDWGSKTNLQTHAGLSEFVILPNSQVSTPIEVKRVVKTEEYCK